VAPLWPWRGDAAPDDPIYRLVFPRQGQTCHAYCSYCFRWAQFVDEPELKMATDDISTLAAWRQMWRAQVRMGMIPYYMFVERDTGPQDYFAVPLARGYEIFRVAYQGVSGLARTVRGPSMSASPGPSAAGRCRPRQARCASTA
jgi:L-lysine 2,3-aminomutase